MTFLHHSLFLHNFFVLWPNAKFHVLLIHFFFFSFLPSPVGSSAATLIPSSLPPRGVLSVGLLLFRSCKSELLHASDVLAAFLFFLAPLQLAFVVPHFRSLYPLSQDLHISLFDLLCCYSNRILYVLFYKVFFQYRVALFS